MPTRVISTFAEAQRALRDILDWRDRISTKDWDFHKLRIKNASPAVDQNDYVILSQLQSGQANVSSNDLFYSIPFSVDSPNDGDTSPAFTVGNGREGIPYQVWFSAQTAPSTLCSINFIVRTRDLNNNDVFTTLLEDDLVLPIGQTWRVYTSTFTRVATGNSLIKLQNLCEVYPRVVKAGGAGKLGIGLVVKRIL